MSLMTEMKVTPKKDKVASTIEILTSNKNSLRTSTQKTSSLVQILKSAKLIAMVQTKCLKLYQNKAKAKR